MESRKIRYQFDRLPMVLFIACLAITVVAGKLKPVYEDNREGYKLFKFLKPVVFTCTADTAAENEKVVWSKMDTEKKAWKNVREVSDLSGRFQIIPKEGKFVIEKGREEDVGNYSCSLGDVSYTFNTYAAVVVAVPKHVYAVEEEKIEIECNVKGTNPSISWEFRRENRPENETKSIGEDGERIKLSEYKNVEDAKLTIERANLTDRGFYFCIGTNELMDDTARAEAYVRVKDKLAALWPFLGICAEVFVLCAIILIYEKRRNKTELEESDTDQSPDQKNDQHMKDSDVRHRK